MPHIIFKGIGIEEVKRIEQPIINAISEIINCPVEHFTAEWMHTLFISNGIENNGGYPFVNVNWFQRTQEMQDEVAKIITDFVVKMGYDEVCVMFNTLNPNAYYENGKHY